MMSTAREGGGETRMPALLGFSRPAVLLRAEGATLLLTSVLLYWMNGGSWLLFALLLLAPDLSMLGYLAGSRSGAAIYNVFHAYPLPAVLGAFGLLGGSPPAVAVALVWFAHIGMDRLVGYGLKYPTEAKDTHLGRV
jgi:hypothetical protein